MTGQINKQENQQVSMHHVGILVHHIEDYMATSFWTLQSPIVYDPIQKARLCLVCIPTDDNHLVELIEPIGEGSPAFRALHKGQKQHHICFETPSTQVAETFMNKYRLLPVTKWEPAVLFRGRLVRFAYTRNRELVEFVADERVNE